MTKSRKNFISHKIKEGYYKEAKIKNVRARSYFKLEQINKKFNIITNNKLIIDLGCAPGGWLQYIDEFITKGKVIGIDLIEIKRQKEFSKNIEIIEDDFNNIEEYKLGEFDLVLSDMAPEFSGDNFKDRGKTHKLNLLVLEFCKNHLKQNGNCIFKTFEGEDLNYVRMRAKKIFKIVKDYKPNSSQKKSSELFVVCLSKK